MKIAYCGRVGSFSHEASSVMFPNGMFYGFNTFIDAIKSVENGVNEFAVIPIENSTAGRVAEIHNILPEVNLFITREKILPIVHNLYVIDSSVTMNEITTVASHPQALMQCSNFIGNLQKQEELNTAIAAENLTKNRSKNLSVICSKAAGDFYNLHLLKSAIQNNNDNYTTFIAFSKKKNDLPINNPVTSIIFTINNKTGGIYESLGCFAKNNVNLIKLESYIPTGSSKMAQFFITFQGSNTDENVTKAISQLQTFTLSIKNLSSYEADPQRFF